MPGPGHNLLFNWSLLRMLREDFLGFLSHMTERYGPVSQFRVGPQRVFLINDPSLINQILTSRSPEFQRTRSQKRLFGRIVGNGLIVSDGEHWQRQRRLAQPAFHEQQLVLYLQTMQSVASAHVKEWPADTPFDFQDAVTRLTLGIVARTLLGSQPPADVDKLSVALDESQRIAVSLMKTGISIPPWLPSIGHRRLDRSVAVMDSVILPLIAERRSSPLARNDLLSTFIAAVDSENPQRRMTDTEVRDEVVTMFLAGHDTTANLLTWTMYLLCKYPAACQRLQQEVDSIYVSGAPEVTGFRQAVYADMVLRESMRLYPSVYLILREPVADTYADGYKLHRKQMIMLCPYLVHRDPANFPDPLSFDPDRFSQNCEKPPAGAYIPFGAGPHHCIGRNFAMMEALVVLATILREYTPQLATEQAVEPDPLITLKVKNGLNVVLSRRI